MGARPIRRIDGEGVGWTLDLQNSNDGVWGYWIAVGPDDFPTGYDGSKWAPNLDWTDPTLLVDAVVELEVPAPGYCVVCENFCFLDGTVRHASHCSQRYWHLTFDPDDGHARRGQTKTDKELLRIFKQAGLKSTHEWVQAPALGLPNWSTYQRRFSDDDRRREGETLFAFLRRISARVR